MKTPQISRSSSEGSIIIAQKYCFDAKLHYKHSASLAFIIRFYLRNGFGNEVVVAAGA